MKRLTLAVLGAVLAALLLAGPAAAKPIEIETINGSETAALSFSGRPAVAADETSGDLFVLDPGNDVIDRFHFDGSGWKPIAELKGSETTAGSFGFNATFSAVAIAQTTSDLYVFNGESSLFAFAPNPSKPSGYEELWERSFSQGGPGSIWGIAVDPQGNPWASFREDGEVKQLSPATGEPTGEHVVAADPVRFAFDSAGALYVTGDVGDRTGISKYVGGQFVETFDAGNVNIGLATDAGTGHLFSAAAYGLKEWDSSGNELPEVERAASGLYWNIAVNSARHRVFVGETEHLVRVFALPAPLSLNINGHGTVECGETGFTEPCGSYLPGEVVKLVANAKPGYAFAGWIGCKQTGENTCEVTVTKSTEVTAVFFRVAVDGTNGTNGTNGQNGAPGPEGKQGPQGPAGKVTVTCKVKQKGKKVKVTCTVKQSASASSAHWRLMRAGRAYRHGIARHGRLRLANLSAGHYRLYVEGKKEATEIIVG